MLNLLNRFQDGLDATRRLDFLAPLLLRLYLVPIFWMAGTHKLADMESTIAWFGNPDWGLGLPFPALLAWLAWWARQSVEERGPQSWRTVDAGEFLEIYRSVVSVDASGGTLRISCLRSV